MPYRYYAGMLALIAMIPLFGHSLLPGPGEGRPGYDIACAAITVTTIISLLTFLQRTPFTKTPRAAIASILKHKRLCIAIGYIIFLILFFHLLADHIILDI
jgi:hypothetical protein